MLSERNLVTQLITIKRKSNLSDSHTNAKLIFLNRYYWPDHSATSQLLSELAPALSRHSFDVHVITSRLLYDEPYAKLVNEQIQDDVSIHRIYTSRFGRANLIGRAIDYLSFYLFACLKLLRISDYGSVIIAKTDPPMLSVPCSWIAKLRGAKQINWLQDVYPEIVDVLQPGTFPKWLLVLLAKIRNKSLKRSAINVTISNDMAQYLIKQGIPREKVTVIENWVDTDLIRPIPSDKCLLRKEWGLEEKLVIMYSGNMGRSHDIDTIIFAAEKLKDDKDIEFLFVGGGAQKQPMIELTQRLGLQNVLFKDYQPRESLSQSLAVGDIHIVSLKIELTAYIYPSKLYGVLAAGRPVIFIGDENSSLAQYIIQNNLGVVMDNEVDKLANTIMNFKLKQNMYKNTSNNARYLAENYHSREAAQERWNLMIENL